MKIVRLAVEPVFVPVTIVLETRQDVINMREVCKEAKHHMLDMHTNDSDLDRWQYDIWAQLGSMKL